MDRAVAGPAQSLRSAVTRWQLALGVALVLSTSGLALATEDAAPLHERIDQLLAAESAGVAAPLVGDAEFLRRISLDLIGVPPTVDELRAFLADADPAKREATVDRLLNHPRYAGHMADVFDVMLMERRPNVHVTADEWRQFLEEAFRENRPYHELARSILAANGAEPQPRAAVRFYLDRLADPNLLTRDVGRIFFGRDMQCAQCHDHPTVVDYLQADYHGLLAFFSSGSEFVGPAPDGKTYYAEKAGERLTFESVFVEGKHTTGPRLLGLPALEEPALYPDELYTVKPAEGIRPVPAFSRRTQLAELATSGSNRLFNENIVNRLWAHMMGRGLVEPVDLHHAENPPTHPELLRLLGAEFAAGGFNVKAFWRELALTEAYQRSIDAPPDPVSHALLAASLATELEHRLSEAKRAAEDAEEVYQRSAVECTRAAETAAPVLAELDQATAAGSESAAKFDEANRQFTATQAQVAAKTAVAQTLADAIAKTQEVAQALPEDQELAAAAQKFVERQQQLSAEVGTLAAEAEAKKRAVAEAQQSVAATRQAIDAVRVKFAPLAAELKQKDQAAAAARVVLNDQAALANRMEQALATLQKLADLRPLQDRIDAARAQATTAETAATAAASAVEAQRRTIAAGEQARVAAAAQAEVATAATAAAQAEHERWAQLIANVTAAIAQTDAARQQLPDDAQLQQASDALNAKLADLQVAEAEPRRQLAEAVAAEEQAQQQLAAANVQLQTAVAELSQRQQLLADSQRQLALAQADVDGHGQCMESALASLQTQWSNAFAMRPLKPLTPEQMCSSALQVTGVYDRYMAAEQAELDKTAPLSESDKQDPAKLAARELELQRRVYDKLKANVGSFVSLYAPAAGQPQCDFFSSANQALFASNGGEFNGWVVPASANVTERIAQQDNPLAAAEDLYLTILNRLPDEAEAAEVARYLAARPEQKAATVQELVWGLLTSVEFRFNH
jgi:hypothetical protein